MITPTSGEFELIKKILSKDNVESIYSSGRKCNFKGCEGILNKSFAEHKNKQTIIFSDKIPRLQHFDIYRRSSAAHQCQWLVLARWVGWLVVGWLGEWAGRWVGGLISYFDIIF